MGKKITIIISIVLLLTSLHIRGQTRAQFVVPTDSPQQKKTEYVPNQVIVKFKKNSNPTMLAQQIVVREKREQSALGRLQLWLQNMSYAIRNEALPKTKLARINAIDNQVGLIERTLVSSEAPTEDPDLFLITTDGSMSVLEMIKKYESLPEVEYAQPNNIYSILK